MHTYIYSIHPCIETGLLKFMFVYFVVQYCNTLSFPEILTKSAYVKTVWKQSRKQGCAEALIQCGGG